VLPALAAVPVVWCAAVLAVMRPDAVAARADLRFEIKWLLYDESDLTALALRGANAHMGRLPGRPDEAPMYTEEEFAAILDGPQEPPADQYYLEYPTPTLVLFRLGFLHRPRTPDLLPPAVADAQQYAIGFFHPRTDAERAWWTVLHDGVAAIVVAMAACLVGLILVLRRGYEPGDPPPWTWLCVLPGAVFFSLNRFDVLPALLTAAGFALMGRKRDGWSGAAFALAALLKLYPVVLAPIILRYLGVRRGAAWLAAFAGTGLAAMGVSVWELGWDPTVGPIRVQLSRTFVPGSWTLYEKVIPVSLAYHGTARLGVLAAAVLLAAATRPAGLPSLLRRCAAVLVVFVVLAVFWSPQWIVWFLPLLAPLAPRRRWVGVAAVLLDAVNYLSFPVVFWIVWLRVESLEVFDTVAGAAIWVRAALWLGLGAGLAFDEWRATRAARTGPVRGRELVLRLGLAAAVVAAVAGLYARDRHNSVYRPLDRGELESALRGELRLAELTLREDGPDGFTGEGRYPDDPREFRYTVTQGRTGRAVTEVDTSGPPGAEAGTYWTVEYTDPVHFYLGLAGLYGVYAAGAVYARWRPGAPATAPAGPGR
jgi:hypothetical protein